MAQAIGTFRWGLTPFCNVIIVSVTQTGGMFTLDGFDDQCGAATRAAVAGTAFPNPNGSIGIGLSIVATPGAAPVHVDVTLSLATIGGPWRDSAGNTGTFLFNPPTPAPGSPRPATGGLISTITPGAGLVGGGTTGTVSLSVDYGGTGAASTAARSDHTHAGGGTNNVAVGPSALASVTSGSLNTAIGRRVLTALTTGQLNTALGNNALSTATTALGNVALGSNTLTQHNGQTSVAVGADALSSSTTAVSNTAVGTDALQAVVTGGSNTAVGAGALAGATGSGNVAVGSFAGNNLTTGNVNIYLASPGPAAAGPETGHIRIGNNHSSTFIAGIRNGSVDTGTDLPVMIDMTGKLGTALSSARVKRDILPLEDNSGAMLRLAPVSFRYTPDQQRGDAIQYGLIAEQVAEVMPELVVNDDHGQPLTVKYQLLPTLLLAEVQRLERERAAQAAELQELRGRLQALERNQR